MKYSLRPWKTTDAHSLAKYANNINIASKLTDKFPHPYTLDNAKDFINFAQQDSGHQIFAIEIDKEACGGIGLHPQSDVFRLNAELGYWLGEPFWGNGVITSAIKEIVEFGFTQMEIQRIFARPFGSNVGSMKVLEKAGFKLEGKFEKTILKQGQLEDEYIYAMRRMVSA